jgi:hypothetical protein
MSSAGHIFDMIARVKANVQRKRRPFDREVEASGPAIRPEYLRKASEEELAYWREKVLADQRIQQRRTRFALLVVVLLVLGAVLLLEWNAPT